MLTRNASRILIVGAGAVGQVYGYHLTQAGCDVSFLVKPKYAAAAREGFELHHHTFRRPTPVKYKPVHVFTSPEEARGIWHQVWLCVPSPAIYEPWLDTLAAWMGGEATVVAFQPGLDEIEHICARIPRERVVEGMIGMISYQAPLPGEHLAPGVAYFFPPFSPTLFGGSRERALTAVELLQRGGCPAAHAEDTRVQAQFGTSLLTPMIAGLEVSDWSFERFTGSQMLAVSLEAAAEAERVVATESRTTSWILPKLRRPWIFKLGLPIARALMPFPLETYLRYHFSKVRPQTQQNLRQFVDHAVAHQHPTAALRRLTEIWHQALDQRPGTAMADLALLEPARAPVASIPVASVSASFSAVKVPVLEAPPVDDEPTPVASVSASFAAVNVPILEAPPVDDDSLITNAPTTPRPVLSRNDDDPTTSPRVAIPPVETAPAVLVTDPSRRGTPPPEAPDDNTPLPGGADG